MSVRSSVCVCVGVCGVVCQSLLELCAASRLTTWSSVRLLLLPADCWPITIWGGSRTQLISRRHGDQEEHFRHHMLPPKKYIKIKIQNANKNVFLVTVFFL